MFIYAVKDAISNTYSNLQTHSSDAVAIREYTIATRNPQTLLNQFPNDYELHLIGEFREDKVIPLAISTSTVIITSATVIELDKIQEKNEQIPNQAV